MSTSNRRALADVFAGAAAGDYELPQELVRIDRAISLIEGEVRAHARSAPDPNVVEARHVAELVAAATDGVPLPSSSALTKTSVALVEHGRRAVALRSAAEVLDLELGAVVAELSEVIVTDFLQPRFEETITEVMRLVPAVPAQSAGTRCCGRPRARGRRTCGWVSSRARIGRSVPRRGS
jgi:hypothetical protein